MTATDQYEKLACSFFNNSLESLVSVVLASGATFGLVNPSAAMSAILEGAPQCALSLPPPASLSSAITASEMVEVYAQVVARDVSFIDYSTDATITSLLGVTRLNAPGILTNLPDIPSNPFTALTIFRGNAVGCTLGPHISQLFLLNVPTASTTSFLQQYTTYLPRFASRVEWGISATEMIGIQNGIPSGPVPALDTPKYIYNGRTLAEAVHNDAVYQYYYQATLILLGLGAATNSTFPSYANQDPFITNAGVVNILTALSAVAKLALKHAWYWKWAKYRRLRPEVYSLWVHNVLSIPSVVPNSANYDLSTVVLTNLITTIDIPAINVGWGTVPTTYTLPLTFRSGSPSHPSYPAGHAVLSGACATILKMFFDGEVVWTTLSAVVEANTAGDTLVPFGGSTAGMTVGTEINKLASNIVLGRDWAGVHYRTDGTKGMDLGEQIAMKYMGDLLSVSPENNLPGNTPPAIVFRQFNGELATVVPTTCQ
uniref:PAP2 superfamily protein n=1 Tax=Pithovirus LCPAC304 TaxID=2506594 RepID=A0A481ZA50_9VIRU|nr:MAG: hypothetical protein LCPAC304_05890 [Pithovirus LCPAC304]